MFTSEVSLLHSLCNFSALTGPGRGSEDLQLHFHNYICAGVCLQARCLWIPTLLQGQVVDVTLSKATPKVVDPKQIIQTKKSQNCDIICDVNAIEFVSSPKATSFDMISQF